MEELLRYLRQFKTANYSIICLKDYYIVTDKNLKGTDFIKFSETLDKDFTSAVYNIYKDYSEDSILVIDFDYNEKEGFDYRVVERHLNTSVYTKLKNGRVSAIHSQYEEGYFIPIDTVYDSTIRDEEHELDGVLTEHVLVILYLNMYFPEYEIAIHEYKDSMSINLAISSIAKAEADFERFKTCVEGVVEFIDHASLSVETELRYGSDKNGFLSAKITKLEIKGTLPTLEVFS